MSGPGAGGRQTASAVLGDVVSVMTGGARPPAPPLPLRLIEDVESAFYLHLDVADRPGVLAAVTQVLGEQEVSIKSVVQRGMGENARLVMVTHPVLESSLRAAIEPRRRVRLRALAAAHDPGHRRGVPVTACRAQETADERRHVPLIERYRERLPFARRRPAREPAGGLDAAAARAGALGDGRRDRAPEARGREPDRLVQGPRHDLRGLGRGARRRQGRDLRLDRQHRGERGRLRGARRHHLRGDRARRQDRAGQDGPDADARRARDLAGGQLRPGARRSCAS